MTDSPIDCKLPELSMPVVNIPKDEKYELVENYRRMVAVVEVRSCIKVPMTMADLI